MLRNTRRRRKRRASDAPGVFYAVCVGSVLVVILPDEHFADRTGGLYDVYTGRQLSAGQAGLDIEDGYRCIGYRNDTDFFGAVGFKTEGGSFRPELQTGFEGGAVGDIGILFDTGNRDHDRGTNIFDNVDSVAVAGLDRFAAAGGYDGDGLVVVLIRRKVEMKITPTFHLIAARNWVGNGSFDSRKGHGV